MILFVINGTARSGKDSFVGYVAKHLKDKDINVHCISSVGKVKEAAYALGWDGEKDEKGRKFLSDLKDLSTEAYDGAMKYMESCLSDDCAVYFFMIREPKEIAKFVSKYPDTRTILITRPDITQYNNHADALVAEYNYTFKINNTRTIEDLDETARLFTQDYIFF